MAGDEVYDVVSPYGYPGLLLSDAARMAPAFAREAMHRLSETLRDMGVCSAFFRMHPLLSDGLSELFPEGFFTPAGATVAMDLTVDDRELWKAIRDGHQWTIKKCKKLGFVPRMVSLREHIDLVMEIYWETMDRVQAKESYYFGREYFARLGEMPGQVHCCVVESERQQAAACIFFECGGIVQAHLGGTRSEFLTIPFHLLLYSRRDGPSPEAIVTCTSGVASVAPTTACSNSNAGSLGALSFSTLRLITDEGKYRELTKRRAQAANVLVEDVSCRDFFPPIGRPFESKRGRPREARGARLAEEPPGTASHPVRHATAPQGPVADRDEHQTEDEAAHPEPHGRGRADQSHPEDVQGEPEIGRLGRRPIPVAPNEIAAATGSARAWRPTVRATRPQICRGVAGLETNAATARPVTTQTPTAIGTVVRSGRMRARTVIVISTQSPPHARLESTAALRLLDVISRGAVGFGIAG